MTTCGNCPFYKNMDGHRGCELIWERMEAGDECNYVAVYEFMTPAKAVKILHTYQVWRRGSKKVKMPIPTVIGYAIDESIRVLREHIKNTEYDYTRRTDKTVPG